MAEHIGDAFPDRTNTSENTEGLGEATERRREALEAKYADDREVGRLAWKLGDIDQTIGQANHVLEHLTELTAGMTHARIYRQESQGRSHYFVNEPPQAPDAVLVPSAHDLLEEIARLDARKAEILAQLEALRERRNVKKRYDDAKMEQTRGMIQRGKDTHTNESINLRNTIREVKQIGGSTLYVSNGRYYPSNPTRVSVGWNASESLSVTEVSLHTAQERLDTIDLPTSKEAIIHRLDATIDILAQTPKDGKGAPSIVGREFRENLRKVLVNVRLGISDFRQLSASETFDPIAEASAIQRLTRLADTNIEAVDIPTILTTMGDLAHVFRYGVSDSVAVILSTIRSLTSNRIYQLGEPAEPRSELLAWLSQEGRAITAGGIDGVLDYAQAFVDTITVPDKIIHNALDIAGVIRRDGKEFFASLGPLLADNLKTDGDRDYCLAYVASVIASMCAMPCPLTVASIPAEIVKALKRVLQKTGAVLDGVTEGRIAELIEHSHIAETAGRYLHGWAEGAERVVAEGSDKTDTASTGTQRLRDLTEEARLARVQALLKAITDTTILTNIFGDRITANMGAGDPKVMGDNAMEIYLQTLGKDAGYTGIDQLKDAIAQTKGDTEYQLVRVYDRYEEVREIMEREIMEREVMPIINIALNLKNQWDIVWYEKYSKTTKSHLSTMSELGKSILQRYL